MRAALPVTLALLLAPLALAQEHEHGSGNGMAMVLHDGPVSGRAVVGGYTHFGFALLDKDAIPTVHQNAQFIVTQNGGVLFSTTDTHEYDGLFSFDIRFTKAGPYQVMAMSGEMEMGFFEGEAVLPMNETAATIELVATPQGPASRAVDFELAIKDAAGAIIPHTDAIVEFRNARDDALYSRTHLHIHEEPILFTQGFGAGTDYVAQLIAYLAFPTSNGDDVPAVIAEFPVSVGPVSAPGIPMPELAPPTPLGQTGGTASADGLTLHLMYDPNQQVGVGHTARLAGAIIDDANFTPLAHVDFALTLNGPRGAIFSSESLHEYDGVFEYLFVPEAPGFYDGTLTAIRGGTELTLPVHLQVIPPAVPVLGGTGLISVAIDGLDDITAGKETNLTFAAMGSAGPAMHSEVDVTIFHEAEPPLYQFKLHTHASGLTNAIVVLPHEGDWKIRVDSLPTVPEASVYPPALFEFSVAPGTTISAVADTAPVADPAAAIPGAWLVLTALALVGASLLRRK